MRLKRWISMPTRCRPSAHSDEARPCAKQCPIAFDAGLTDLLTTLRYHDGQAVFVAVDNPRWLKRQFVNIVEIQRTVSAL
jgi:hypothetical protein